jgi:hypothetical protein
MSASRTTRGRRHGGRNGGIICRRCGIVVVSVWLKDRNVNVWFSSSYIHISPCWRNRASLFEDNAARVNGLAFSRDP